MRPTERNIHKGKNDRAPAIEATGLPAQRAEILRLIRAREQQLRQGLINGTMIQEAVGRQIAGEASRIFESYPFDYLKYRQGTYSEQDKHNVERCTNKMKEFFVLNAPIWLGIPEKKGRLITKLISLQNVAESSGNDLAKKESKFRLLVKKDRQMTSEVISLMLLMQKKLNPLKDHFSNRGSLLPQAESDQNTEIKHIAYWGFQSFRQELHLTLNACRQEIR